MIVGIGGGLGTRGLRRVSAVPINSHPFGLLGLLDWVVVAAYTGGLIFLGLLMSKRRIAPVDYFLASRASQWPVIGLALLPSIIRSQTYTMPEFLERRYDRRVRLHFALLTLFLNIFVDSAGVLYSGSLVCQLLFPGWPLWLIVTLLAGTAGLYTTLGGLRAVIYIEAVQAVVLMLGALMISIGAFSRAGGWHAVMRGVDPAAISLIRPIGDPGVPWPGLLLGIPLLGFYYWCTNQSIVQRMLSAKNTDPARWGALFAGALKLPVLFLIVLTGTCALLLDPQLPRADMVYPKLILELLPTGLVGLVVAGFVAATMVSIASMLNSASTLITMDVIKQFKLSLSDAEIVRIGRVSTAALLVVAVAWAPQLQLFPSLWQYLQAVLAYAVPPVVALFLVGMFWRGANADGAAATLSLGSLLGFALFMINVVFRWTHFHFLYAAPILTVLDAAILVSVSLLNPAPAPIHVSMWKLDFSRAEQLRLKLLPLWQDYRFQAAALLALMAAVVNSFR